MVGRHPAANHPALGAVLALRRTSGRAPRHGGALPIWDGAIMKAIERLDVGELVKIRLALEENDVISGPPLLREVVAELWPEFLHKVKPPLELMH